MRSGLEDSPACCPPSDTCMAPNCLLRCQQAPGPDIHNRLQVTHKPFPRLPVQPVLLPSRPPVLPWRPGLRLHATCQRPLHPRSWKPRCPPARSDRPALPLPLRTPSTCRAVYTVHSGQQKYSLRPPGSGHGRCPPRRRREAQPQPHAGERLLPERRLPQ